MIRIYPARTSGNAYGFGRVKEIIDKEQPDVVIINNDLWIVADYMREMPAGQRVIGYSPVDALPVANSWVDRIKSTNAKMIMYTKFGKDAITAAGYTDDIPIIGHGVDTDSFYPMSDARDAFEGINHDAFIVQNVSRNQPRKRLDLFVKAMKLVIDRLPVPDKANFFFYYHGVERDVGWNLTTLARRYGIDSHFIITDQADIDPSHGVSIQTLCKIYNIADVHVLTSLGEGWGLPPFESAACKVAQVLPNSSACKELWEGKAPLIDIKDYEVIAGGVNTEGAVINIEHLADIILDLYYHRDKLAKYAKTAYDYVHESRFSWESVSAEFEKQIIASLNAGDKALSKAFEEKHVVSTD
jgi:glycosyltransferase involved in cell wall biosynthesis